MSDSQIEFLPYNAINEFMLPEYRLEVIQRVFTHLNDLPGERRAAINHQIKRLVTVPGFRNSAVAPIPLKIKASVSAFERSAALVVQVLSAWAELQPEFCQRVFDFLKARGWDVLPVNADHTVIPGFFTTWPEADSFEVLDQAYLEQYPEKTESENDVRLMIVWLSDRLPLDVVAEMPKLTGLNGG